MSGARLLRYLTRLQAFTNFVSEPENMSDKKVELLEKHLDESWKIVDRREKHRDEDSKTHDHRW